MIAAKVNNLIMARLEKGLDRSSLAKMCGVSHAIIVRIEQGAGTSPKTAKSISDVLGKPVNELFDFIPRRRSA